MAGKRYSKDCAPSVPDSALEDSAEATNAALQSKAHDEALDFLEQHRDAVNVALGFDKAYLRRLRRKLDFYIIPFMMVVYTFNFIDKILLNVSVYR